MGERDGSRAARKVATPPSEDEMVALKASKQEEALQDGKEAAALNKDGEKAAPNLNLDVIAVVVTRLPTKTAYRCTVLSKPINRIINKPWFLKHHLAPRAPSADDVPGGFFLQPAESEGYSHLTLVDPFGRRISDLVVRPDGDASEEYNVHTTEEGVAAPIFFDKTVRELDVHFVASYGRLLLGRSSNAFFVCSPEEDRWISLPLPLVPDNVNTAAGLRYEADQSSGLNFAVLVVVPIGSTDVEVKTFSSADGVWSTAVLPHEAVASLLGNHRVGPGIYAGDAFFWKSGDRKSGIVLSYNPLNEQLTVIGEPPKEEGYTLRAGTSLGSSGGRLRLYTFDVASEGPYGFEVVALDANLSTWEANGAGDWTRIRSMAVDEVCWDQVHRRGFLNPLDYDGARAEWLVVRKDDRDLFYLNVESGEISFLTNLYHRACSLAHDLYSVCDAFPFFV